MATLKALRERWQTEEGLRRSAAITAALAGGCDQAELVEIVAGFEYTDEVAPALDLRGLVFDFERSIDGVELSGARLDGCTLKGDLWKARLSGAVLDGVQATSRAFSGDFTEASFRKAKLAGATFMKCALERSDFSGARLMRSLFEDSPLREAHFVGADLRSAVLAYTDLRGADLTGADCTEAALGRARFDESTKLKDAKLTVSCLDSQFEAHARAQGANLLGELATAGFEEIDATLAVLNERNQDGHLDRAIKLVRAVRTRAGQQPQWDWLDHVAGQLGPRLGQELDEAFAEAVSKTEHYLG